MRNRKKTNLMRLPNLLSKKHYTYQKSFKGVFSNEIQVTPSWALATKRPLPVFHRMQRPLEQLLIVDGPKQGYQVIALSQKEARQFKSFLQRVLPQTFGSSKQMEVPCRIRVGGAPSTA